MAWNQADSNHHIDIESGRFIISIASYASHIAVYDTKQIEPTRSIDIFSGSGALVSSISWLASTGSIASIGWIGLCTLVVVTHSGKYRIYHDFQGNFDEYQLPCKSPVLTVHLLPRAMSVFHSDGHFSIVEDMLTDPKASALPLTVDNILSETEKEDGSSTQIHGWTPFASKETSASPIKIIASVMDRIVCISQSQTTPYLQGKGPFDLISVSSNNQLIAFYSSDKQTVIITSSDLSQIIVELKTEMPDIPTDMAWCGNDAVVINFSDALMLVGPSQDSLDFYLDSPALIKSEQDGLFCLTKDQLSWISRVEQATSDTFKIGSTAPSAILVDAIDLFDSHSPKANENIEIIGDSLKQAVDTCISAANEAFSPYWQKKLLRAASFGKITLQLYDPSRFVTSCQYLRILNILRQQDIGIYLTYNQFVRIGPQQVITLLLLRQQHFLCLKIAELLDLSKDDIYLDWVSCKIKICKDIPDEKLATMIVSELGDKHLSFSSLADVAFQEGRQALSIKLLSREPETEKTIPILLDMEQNEYALTKADKDMDVNSILHVLLTLYSKLSLTQFFKILDGSNNSTGIFEANFNLLGDHLLYDYFYQDDFIPGLATIHIHNFLKKNADGESVQVQRADLLKASRLLLRSKSMTLEGNKIKDESDLIKEQNSLARDEIISSANYESVMQTIGQVAVVNLRRAKKLQKDNHVSNEEFYYKVLKVLAPIPEKRSELYEFATASKSPIGYLPFYMELIKYGDKRQASMYVKLCTSLDYKQEMRCYLECDDFRDAVSVAAKKKDSEILEALKSVTTNQSHRRLIDDTLESITGTRRF